MRIGLWIGLMLACAVSAQGPASTSKETGPPAGARVPDFEAVDQNGVRRTLASIMGPKGAVLVFYRSADW